MVCVRQRGRAGHRTLLTTTTRRPGRLRSPGLGMPDAYVDPGLTATGEPPTGSVEPLAARGGLLDARPRRNGPLVPTGNLEIRAGTGRIVARVTETRPSRCGQSRNKPFCDPRQDEVPGSPREPVRPRAFVGCTSDETFAVGRRQADLVVPAPTARWSAAIDVGLRAVLHRVGARGR